MNHWQKLDDIDAEMISTVLWEFYSEFEEFDHDIPITIGDVEMLPQLAIRDMERGGEPLIDIRVNQKKLQQLQGSVRAKHQIAETVGELEETHSDREDGIYDFSVTDPTALHHILLNANALRQMNGLPDIAPAELFNTMTAYQHEVHEPMRHMVLVTIDLEVMKRAVEFARRSELEADNYNPYRNSGSDAV